RPSSPRRPRSSSTGARPGSARGRSPRSCELEPAEPDRVVLLVPGQDLADEGLLVGREDGVVDPVEVDTDAVLAEVLESLRRERLELVSDPARVGDLHRPRLPVLATVEAVEERRE